MRRGIVLELFGHTTSAFHSTRQEFANLLKCSPYILGSTIRGALLARLLERGMCPHLAQLNVPRSDVELAELHRDCALRPFFPRADEAPSVWFSFGRFTRGDATPLSAEEMNLRYHAHTRIGLERAHGSVAEGAIVTIEAIQPETPLRFEVILLDEARALADELAQAAEVTGTGAGWGRFRSIGFGQFKITRVRQTEFTEWIDAAANDWLEVTQDRVAFEFETPYVLSRGEGAFPAFDSEAGAARLHEQFNALLHAVGQEALGGKFNEVGFAVRPEFVSPFSFERGTRQHSLVSLEGSWVAAKYNGDAKSIAQAFALASRMGLGTWNTTGFGRFRRKELSPRERRIGVSWYRSNDE